MRTSLLIVVVLSLASPAACTSKEAARTSDSTAAAAPTIASAASAAPTTKEGKIQNAMSAAPDSVSQAATIMDWPATERGKFTQLRAGTNGWVCYPSTPAAAGAVGQDPMCLDAEFQKWAGAWMTKKSPHLAGVAVAYMLQGDRGASIADPFAKNAADAKDWVVAGPHIMVTTPNTASPAAPSGAPAGGTRRESSCGSGRGKAP